MAGSGRRNRRPKRGGFDLGPTNSYSNTQNIHSDHSLLPITTSHIDLSNTVSCWYCDYKIAAFNQPLFCFGRRYARILRAWFSIGIGFSVAALFGVTMILFIELARALNFFDSGNMFWNLSLSSSSIFGISSLTSWNISPIDVGYIFLSTLISVSLHEFGHAVSAASEGIQLEYVAVFVAILFPGALVAFNHELLQVSSSCFTALRVYSAGIWHNAVFSAACGLVLFFLPVILFPFYIHGQSPMVLGVPATSPLSGYLSPGNVVLSLDGVRIYNSQEWIEVSTSIDELTFQKENFSKQGVEDRKGYCVPNFMMEESKKVASMDNQSSCSSDLSAFSTISCFNKVSMLDYDGRERICLNAKDVVKLNRCSNGTSCLCSKDETCLSPVQVPGSVWVEITYSSSHASKCLQLEGDSLMGKEDCGVGTFVFVGDLISMANSVWLTSYIQRWELGFFLAYLPDFLERMFMCSFHISLALALLNSLPVYYLDGESVIEVILFNFTSFSPRKKRKFLQACLFCGTVLSLLAFIRFFFSSFAQL